MAFGKTIESTGTSSTGGNGGNIDYEGKNNYIFDMIDAEVTKNKRGDDVKEFSALGVLNYMMTLGLHEQGVAEYDTKCALPAEGEENSQEEIEYMEKFKGAFFKWVEKDGKQIRKQCRNRQPEEELVLAFDFPSIMVEHDKFSAEGSDGIGTKPLRISWNGWFNPYKQFNTHVRNQINYKTKEMSDSNPLYKIAKAGGVLDEYIKSGYNYGVLAECVVNLDVVVEKSIYNGKTYLNYAVRNPSKVEDIKFKGKVMASKEEQLEEAKTDVEFVGIEFDSRDEQGNLISYDIDDLKQIRKEWKIAASRAVSYKPSPVNYPDFVKGCNWEESSLYKALEANGLLLNDAPQASQQQDNVAQGDSSNKSETPQQKAPEKAQKEVIDNEPPAMDWDQEIPFIDPYRRTLKLAHCM